MNKIVTYSAALIGVYLVVSHATGAGKLLTGVTNGYAKGVKTLQGRA